jgi:hypothetical protein
MMRTLFAWLAAGLTLGFAGASMTALFLNASLGSSLPLVMWVGFGLLGLAVLLAMVILVSAAIG